MRDMPEFVVQLEQASGLPWWCLLLLAALVLLVIVLAVALSRANRRAKAVAVDIPKAPVQGESSATEESAAEGDPATEELPVTGESAAEADPGTEEEPATEVNPPAAEPPDSDDEPVVVEEEPATKAAPDTEGPTPEDELPPANRPQPRQPERSEESPTSQPEAAPASELLEYSFQSEDPALDLSDEELLKAAMGEHVRFSQSPYGIDFGFLEEYEEEYQHALDEFQRLRGKNNQD